MRKEAIEATKDDPRKMLVELREQFKQIPLWNAQVIQEQSSQVLQQASESLRKRINLDSLIQVCLLSTAKIMGTPRLGRPSRKVLIDQPDSDIFIRDAFIFVAKTLWPKENLILFTNKASKRDQLKNFAKIKKIICRAIEEFILTSVPLEDILKASENEVDLVEEAKQILEEVKEEVSLREGAPEAVDEIVEPVQEAPVVPEDPAADEEQKEIIEPGALADPEGPNNDFFEADAEPIEAPEAPTAPVEAPNQPEAPKDDFDSDMEFSDSDDDFSD